VLVRRVDSRSSAVWRLSLGSVLRPLACSRQAVPTSSPLASDWFVVQLPFSLIDASFLVHVLLSLLVLYVVVHEVHQVLIEATGFTPVIISREGAFIRGHTTSSRAALFNAVAISLCFFLVCSLSWFAQGRAVCVECVCPLLNQGRSCSLASLLSLCEE
jgi:hypothetical protein